MPNIVSPEPDEPIKLTEAEFDKFAANELNKIREDDSYPIGFYAVPRNRKVVNEVREQHLFFLLSFDMKGYYHPIMVLLSIVPALIAYFFAVIRHSTFNLVDRLKKLNQLYGLFISGATVEIVRRYIARFNDFHYEVTAKLLSLNLVQDDTNHKITETLYKRELLLGGSIFKHDCRLMMLGPNTNEKENHGKLIRLDPELFEYPRSLGKLYADHVSFLFKIASSIDPQTKRSLRLTPTDILQTAIGYRIAHETVDFFNAYQDRFKIAGGEGHTASCAWDIVAFLIWAGQDMGLSLDGLYYDVINNDDEDKFAEDFLVQHYGTTDFGRIRTRMDKSKDCLRQYLRFLDEGKTAKEQYEKTKYGDRTPFKLIAAWGIKQKINSKQENGQGQTQSASNDESDDSLSSPGSLEIDDNTKCQTASGAHNSANHSNSEIFPEQTNGKTAGSSDTHSNGHHASEITVSSQEGQATSTKRKRHFHADAKKVKAASLESEEVTLYQLRQRYNDELLRSEKRYIGIFSKQILPENPISYHWSTSNALKLLTAFTAVFRLSQYASGINAPAWADISILIISAFIADRAATKVNIVPQSLRQTMFWMSMCVTFAPYFFQLMNSLYQELNFSGEENIDFIVGPQCRP